MNVRKRGAEPVHHGHLRIAAGGKLLLVLRQEPDAGEQKGIGKIDADIQKACGFAMMP